MTYDTYQALIAACEAIEEFDLSERDTSEVCAELRSLLRYRKEAYETYKALIAACEAIEEFDMSEPDIGAVCAELRGQLRKRREDGDMDAWRSKELAQ